jgi:enamine deaminase RidA (YjgF/YER057c/UK114 family)
MNTTTDITRIDQNHRRSRALIHNGIVYTSGQIPDDMAASIEEQTKQILKKIDDLLRLAGTDKTRLLTAQIWLSSIADFQAMNTVWDAWVTPEQRPTRCCGEVKMNNPACRVEITVTAAV